ncbi:MAG: DMT family transporter [Gammaproteobacteria bacterium]|nr:DMT family transporter [Gammaproteobacteria bacterium]
MNLGQGFWLGSFFALCSAIAFALNLCFARIAYDHGANLHALNGFRSLAFLLYLVLVVAVSRQTISIPSKDKAISLFLGVLLCGEMYALLSAILFIPVALAILVMYTYPMMIAVYGWVSGRNKISYLAALMLLIAFAGLFVALENSTASFGGKGMLFSAFAAIALATMLLLSERVLKNNDNTVVMLYMLFSTCLIVAMLSVTIVDLDWPESIMGWTAFCVSAVFYVLATFMLFKAVNLIGPLHTAIIDNTSPVWAIGFSFLILNQALRPTQITGAIIVVCAVILLQWTNRPAPE